jgi:hypothetical protein
MAIISNIVGSLFTSKIWNAALEFCLDSTDRFLCADRYLYSPFNSLWGIAVWKLSLSTILPAL